MRKEKREKRLINIRASNLTKERKKQSQIERKAKSIERQSIVKIIIGAIIIFMILVNFIRSANGYNNIIGFNNLIEILQTLSNTYITLPTLQDLTIVADWGAFEFLKNTLNTIISIFNVLLFISQTILNMIIGLMAAIRQFLF